MFCISLFMTRTIFPQSIITVVDIIFLVHDGVKRIPPHSPLKSLDLFSGDWFGFGVATTANKSSLASESRPSHVHATANRAQRRPILPPTLQSATTSELAIAACWFHSVAIRSCSFQFRLILQGNYTNYTRLHTLHSLLNEECVMPNRNSHQSASTPWELYWSS